MMKPDFKKYDRVALDTETTGFHHNDVPVGLSWATPDGKAGYLRWGHKGGGNNISLTEFRDWMMNTLLGFKGRLLFQYANFDIRMLDNVGIPLVDLNVRIEDTMFMAAVLNELEPSFSLGPLLKKYTDMEKLDDSLNEIVEQHFDKPKGAGKKWQGFYYWQLPGHLVEQYAIADAVGLLALDNKFSEMLRRRDLMNIYAIETAQIPILARMYRHGVRVDVDRAREHRDRIADEIEERMVEWERVTGGVPLSGPGSRKELYTLWEKEGLPFETTRKGNPSINKGAIIKAKETGHRLPSLLEELRTREKMKTTFLEGYILDQHVDGRIHAQFHPLRNDDFGTVSGRFSSSNPNLQNPYSPENDDLDAPLQDQYGHLFRSLFIPEPGADWVSIDYSQIEYRFFAHYAGGRVLEAYRTDPDTDFHGLVAELAGMDRKPAKNLNFAKLYGAGAGKVASMLSDTFGRNVSLDEAYEFINQYDSRIPEASNLLTLVKHRAESRGYIKTWGGRRRRFRRRGGRYIGTHAALNALLQGSAADLMKRAMIDLQEVIDWDSVILHLTVHDEVDLSVRKDQVREWIPRAKEIMEDYELSLPVLVDAKVGSNWGYLEDYDA